MCILKNIALQFFGNGILLKKKKKKYIRLRWFLSFLRGELICKMFDFDFDLVNIQLT